MNVVFEIFLIFVLPIVLWAAGVVKAKYRELAMMAMGAVAGYIVFTEQWPLERLGIRTDNLAQTFLPYFIIGIISVIFLFLFARINGRKFRNVGFVDFSTIFWPTIGSVLQEFLYRGYLMAKLGEIMSSGLLIILFTTLLFTLIHIVYPEIRSNIPLIFLAGLMFGTMYWFFPNLIWVSIVHMFLNFMASGFGFFTFNPQTYKR